MKTRKLLKALERLFDKKGRKLRKHRDELAELLEKLRAKRKRLAKRLRAAPEGRERERLARKLAILEAQIEKGAATLERLDADLGEP